MKSNELEQELGLSVSGDDSERLVFPFNVHESLAVSGGLRDGEKRTIIMSFWLVACLVLGWFLAGWLRTISPNYYFWIVIGIELVLQLTVGVFILRLVMDEGTLASEMDSKDNSFAKYFGIYHEHLAGDDSPYDFDIIEFNDGSYGVTIQMLFGYNTNSASASTYTVNKTVQSLINRSGMPHRVIYSNENFANSQAANDLRETVNGVTDPKLFKTYRDIVLGLLNKATDESNVVCATYTIYAKTRIHKEDFGNLVTQILSVVASGESAYREAYTLSYKDLVEFYRTYYRLDVLDMGIIRVHSAKGKRISCPVKVLKVYGKSGKVYATQDFSKLKSNILSNEGLEPINKKG